jgi:hypothetical protein
MLINDVVEWRIDLEPFENGAWPVESMSRRPRGWRRCCACWPILAACAFSA